MPLHQDLMLTLYKFSLAQNPLNNPLMDRIEHPNMFDEDNVDQRRVDNPDVGEP